MLTETKSPIMPSTSLEPLWLRQNRTSVVSYKKIFITLCSLIIIIGVIKSSALCLEIVGESLLVDPSASMAADSPALSARSGSAYPCADCGSSRLRLVVAMAQGGQDDRQEKSSPTGISEIVRAAGQMLFSGNQARAREMVQRALRQCDSGEASTRDCAEWMESLRGIERILGKPSDRAVVTNSINMKLVRIPPGEYMMGSPKRELDWLKLTYKKIWRDGHKQWFQDELPLHPVRITKSFYMGITEVTVGQFQQFVNETAHKTDAEKGDGGMVFSAKEARWVPRKDMKWNSTPWKISDNQPVVFVSWNDAQAFCRWLSRKEKRKYRLPTEAEWEMCCRGGLVWARYPWGDKHPGARDSNFGDGNPKLPESLTTVDDGYEYVAPVGSYPPNGFGLHDMAGNVMEWVSDYYSRNYYDESPIEDPQGPSSGTGRVNKGGNWFASPADDRCAFRGFSGPEMSFCNLGFRVVMESEESQGTQVAKGTTSDSSTEKSSTDSAFPPSEEEGMRLFREAMYAAQQQQWDNAIDTLESALKLYEKRQDGRWIPRVRATLAGIYAERNRIYKSKELYTKSLEEFRTIGDTGSARVILARLHELESSPGVKVVQVKPGGIADKAGIVAEDIIIEYAGETGFRVAGFQKLVEEHARSKQVTLSIFNNDEITTIMVQGGPLGVALEDIKRPPRPRRPAEEQRERPRPRPRRDRR